MPIDEKMTLMRPKVNGGLCRKEPLKNKPVNYISVESIKEYIEKEGLKNRTSKRSMA